MKTSRRRFLKTAAGAAAAPLILPNGLRAADKGPRPNR